MAHAPARQSAREPGALAVTLAAKERLRFLGAPEGNLGLAQAAVYLSLAPNPTPFTLPTGNVLETSRKPKADPVPLPPSQRANQSHENIGYGPATNTPTIRGKSHRHVLLPENLVGRSWYKPPDRASNNAFALAWKKSVS